MAEVQVKIALRDDGRYFAASTVASPYFCFEGETEEEVKRIVDDALSFYWRAAKRLKSVVWCLEPGP